jgi:hypothetical protein
MNIINRSNILTIWLSFAVLFLLAAMLPIAGNTQSLNQRDRADQAELPRDREMQQLMQQSESATARYHDFQDSGSPSEIRTARQNMLSVNESLTDRMSAITGHSAQEIQAMHDGGNGWDAYRAFNVAVSTYSAKYPKAMECLEKNKDEMLAFYDIPAAHWQHIRTSNPIESTFATVRLRTAKTRGCVARHTILSMVFKLGQSAQKRWRGLRGFKLLAEVTRGVQFKDGERIDFPEEGDFHRAVI